MNPFSNPQVLTTTFPHVQSVVQHGLLRVPATRALQLTMVMYLCRIEYDTWMLNIPMSHAVTIR